jgi:hypothetical protein
LGIIVFYGVTRYSLFSPGSPSWKTSRSGVFKTPEEYMDYLFSEKRLQMRAELFFTKSVPALAAMAANHDYKHFVLYSELLPEHHKELLFAAAAEHAFLIPVEWNKVLRGTGIEEVTPLIEEDLAGKFQAGDGVQPVMWFRLDDDDVLAADFLTRLEAYRAPNFIGMAISFGLGLTAYRGKRELTNLREFYHPKSAQGMAFVSSFDPDEGRFTVRTPGHHHHVDQKMPTILDSSEHMFFQIRHGDQDSTLNATPHERAAESLARLEKLPVVRAADISAEKWPSLIDDMVSGELTLHELSAPGAEPLRLTEDTVLTFPLEADTGLVEFEFEFESAKNLKGGFAEVSYHLEGADAVDAESLGLKRHSKLGLSRQAWSRKSHGLVRQTVLLPEGVRISGVTLTGKNPQPAEVFIRLRGPRVVEVQSAG